jgi:hypothetical protein
MRRANRLLRAYHRAVPFPRRLLTEGEEIVLDLRPHWIALVKPILWTVVIGSVTGLIYVKIGGKTDTKHVLQLVIVGIAFVLWIPMALWPAIAPASSRSIRRRYRWRRSTT